MKISMFYHSLLSDWNHGNAHFLRGVASELCDMGHQVVVYEEEGNWSLKNSLKEQDFSLMQEFRHRYPQLTPAFYNADNVDLECILREQDLVIVHEWNSPVLVQRIGEYRRLKSFKLLFHDTHHRAVTDELSMSAYNLSNYDGVLAFGNVIRDIYLSRGWAKIAWTWHEAADIRIFQPIRNSKPEGDLVWIGNWGDEERTQELHTFLIEPVSELGLKAIIYGVRYPEKALKTLRDAGIEYGGWLPNYKVPEVFSRYRVTAHIPRRPYVDSLPGIPTIRPFEAMACGIPLISSPWNDSEKLFRPGKDYLVANSKEEMKAKLKQVLNDPVTAENLRNSGMERIRSLHTCRHRAAQLVDIFESINN